LEILVKLGIFLSLIDQNGKESRHG